MPETRVIEQHRDLVNGQSVVIQEVTATISNDQLVEETEAAAINTLAKANALIDAIGSLADAKMFLKKLCTRLV